VNLASGVAYVRGRTGDGRADRLLAGIGARAAVGKPKSRCHAMGVAYGDGRGWRYNPSRRRAAWRLLCFIAA